MREERNPAYSETNKIQFIGEAQQSPTSCAYGEKKKSLCMEKDNRELGMATTAEP
jgi:hypothetical protein